MTKQRRVFQVAEKIRNKIASELYQLVDSRFQLVTVTSVVVSPDLGRAKVYWVTSGDEARIAEVQEAFEKAAGHFRHIVGKDLGTRFVPELKFFYDDTLDTSEKVEQLFAKIRQADEARASEDEASED